MFKKSPKTPPKTPRKAPIRDKANTFLVVPAGVYTTEGPQPYELVAQTEFPLVSVEITPRFYYVTTSAGVMLIVPVDQARLITMSPDRTLVLDVE